MRRATLFLPTDSFPWIARKDTPSSAICIAPRCGRFRSGRTRGRRPRRTAALADAGLSSVRQTANGFWSGCLPSSPIQIRPTGSFDAGHRAAEDQLARAGRLEVEAVEAAVVREPVGQRQLVGAQHERVARLEPVRRDGDRGRRHDPAAEDDLGRARMGRPEVPARRAVPDVVAGSRAGLERGGHALDRARPMRVRADAVVVVVAAVVATGRPRTSRRGRPGWPTARRS